MIRPARLAMAAGALLAACGDGGGADPAAGTGGQTTSSAVTSTGTSSSAGGGGLAGTGGTGGGGGAGPRCASDDGSPEHIVQISSNLQTSLAVSSRGRVACWGYSKYGECAGAGALAPIVVDPGWIPGLSCITQADIDFVVFGLDERGDVLAWGTEFEEEFGDGPGSSSTSEMFSHVHLPAQASSALSDSNGGHAGTTSGTYVWGTVWEGETWSTPRLWPMPPDSRLFRIATTICELDAAGQAKCRGRNTLGELGDGTFQEHRELFRVAGELKFDQLAMGGSFTCGIVTDGGVYCWGFNGEGQLGNGVLPPAATGDNDHERCVPTPSRVSGLTDIRSMDLDAAGACALDGAGTVWCWGENRYERFAEGSQRLFPIPIAVPDLSPARQIAVGDDQICALKLDDTVWCRGNGLTRGIADGVGPAEATQMHFDFEAPP